MSPVSPKDAYPQAQFPKTVLEFFPNERLTDGELIKAYILQGFNGACKIPRKGDTTGKAGRKEHNSGIMVTHTTQLHLHKPTTKVMFLECDRLPLLIPTLAYTSLYLSVVGALYSASCLEIRDGKFVKGSVKVN